jgi:predicted amidohydrolase YtcJ
MQADLILVNGRILTMGRPASAEALAVIGDRVVAAGEEHDVLALRGPRTRVLDLRGRLALPGFTDSHVHLGALAARLSLVRLERAATLSDALRRVAVRARTTPSGEWILGGGFDKNRWGDEFPTRRHLDRVSPDHPVALVSRDGHALWANSLALKCCAITRRTPDPRGGVILRDGLGRPTGMLLESAAGLVRKSHAYPDSAPRLKEIAAALRHLIRHGITSVHLMEEMPLCHLLQELRGRGNPGPRVALYRGVDALPELVAAGVTSGFGDEWLRIAGIKLFLDGSLGSQTAWLFRAHENSAAGRGVPALPPSELRSILRQAADARLACAIHAIGDRANAEALRALAAVGGGASGLPHRIEHAQLLRPADIPRFGQLKVIASMQPCHILGDIEPGERYWGRRCRYAYALRSLLRAGATLAFGSDAPVETADPIAGIYAAVCRQGLDGRPEGGWYRAEEGIGVMAAVRGYTVGPAAATMETRFKGKLSPGHLADIVVLSHDITRLRGPRLLGARVDAVVIGGKMRYRRRGVV